MEVDRDRAPTSRPRVVEGSSITFLVRVRMGEEFGVWRLASGVWRLAFGVWYLILFFFIGHVMKSFVMRGGPTADTVIYGTVEGSVSLILLTFN